MKWRNDYWGKKKKKEKRKEEEEEEEILCLSQLVELGLWRPLIRKGWGRLLWKTEDSTGKGGCTTEWHQKGARCSAPDETA